MDSRRGLTVALAGALSMASCSDDAGSVTSATVEVTAAGGTATSELSVRPGRASWPTGYFQAAVYSALLAELGYEVADPAANEFPVAEAYLAMAAGRFDFWANGWYSQHFTWFDRELDDGSLVDEHVVVIGDELVAGGIDGLVVTKSVAEEHAIESLDQINADPELAALFDHDGDGLGEIYGCPDDWTCDDIISELIEFNGWSNLEQVKAGYSGLVATSIDRVERGLPAIQYTWSPSGHLSRLVPGETVLWLSVGDNENVLDGSTAGEFDFAHAEPAQLGAACTADPCWIGWEVSDIRVAANRDFADANPMAVALFEAVTLKVADIAAQNVLYDNGENTEADVERHAREWIDANRSTVEAWLDAARSAAA